MATGDSLDIQARVKSLLPGRWWLWLAPKRDAILGGLADVAAWCYNWLPYAQLQTRLATATGVWLDIYGYDFLRRYIVRNGMDDATYRVLLKATILQERVTRKGMSNAILALTNLAPSIFEPWNTGDTGAYGMGNWGYGIAGGWGNLQLPAQFFMKIFRRGLGPSGIPWVNGYKGVWGGYANRTTPFANVGVIAWSGVTTAEIGVTDDVIYRTIIYTKPTGTIAWTQIGY